MSSGFVAYFASWDRLVHEVLARPLQHTGTLFVIAFVAAAILFDFGWFRDQMCTLACPYGRLQNVMADPDTILVAYDEKRGEPRATQKQRHDTGRGARGLHRLPAVRDHLPDRRRHPSRPAARVHRLRPVHRRLRHGDGPDRPPPRPHPQHVRARARRGRPALLAAPGAGLPRPPDPRLGHPRRDGAHPRGRARRDPARRPRALPPAAAGRGREPAAHPHHQPDRRTAELHDRASSRRPRRGWC